MEIMQLEFHQYEDKNELLNKLNEREDHFINEFDSIKEGVGWNKVKAPRVKRPLGQNPEETWAVVAKKHGVDQRRLAYQVNKKGLRIEDAVKKVRELDKEPTIQYSYGMQRYDLIRELLIHDKNNIGKKTIERRIGKSKELRSDLDKENNIKTVFWLIVFLTQSLQGEK